MSITIQICKISSVYDNIVDIYRSVYSKHSNYPPDFRKNDNTPDVLIALMNNKILGFVILEKTWSGARHISDICVLPSHQSAGVGTLLMNRLIQEVGSKKTLTLRAIPPSQLPIDTLKLLSFYKRFEFTSEHIPREDTYFIDLIRMQK